MQGGREKAVTLKNIALWIMGLAVITLAVFLMGLEEIALSLSKVSPLTLVFLLMLQMLTLLAGASQWQFLLKKMNKDLSLGLVLAITLAGNYVESVTPAVKLGGEAAKVYLFRQYSSLEYDRLAGILLALKYYSMLPFVCLALFFAGSAFIAFNLPSPVLGAFAFLLVFFAVIVLLYYRAGSNTVSGSVQPLAGRRLPGDTIANEKKSFRKGLQSIMGRLDKLTKFVNRAAMFSRSMTNRLESLALVALSTLVWLVYPIKTYLVARMLGLEIGILAIAVITFTAYLVSMVPLLPGGLGSFEATMALMFSLNGFSPAEGLTVALLARLVTYWVPLLLSAVAAAYLAFTGAHRLKGSPAKMVCPDSRAGTRP